MRHLLSAVLAYLFLTLSVWAQGGMMPGPGTPASTSCSATLALDGTPARAAGGAAATSSTVTMAATSGTTNFFGLIVYINSGTTTVSSVTGGPGGWTNRASVTSGLNHLELWTTTSTSAQTSATITINYSAATNFPDAGVFSFSGTNTSSPFDGAALTGTTAQSITTTFANDVIIGGFSPSSNTATAGAGFTALYTNANFNFAEYQIVSSTQSGLSVGITGDTIAVTIVQAVKRSC